MSEPQMAQNAKTEPLPVCILPDFRVQVENGSQAARLGVTHVLDALEPLGLDVEEIGTVELVLAEALNNVVEHAYPSGNMTGPIGIACTHLTDGLHFLISDKGCAMPDGTIPLGVRPDVKVATSDLPEGGFGWFLIQDLAKDVEYQRVDGENRLSLRIAVAHARRAH